MSGVDHNFSVAGFSLKKDNAAYRHEEALQQIERRKTAEEERALRRLMRTDQNALKIANVNLNQWEIEKEKRVHDAFNRIIEKEWYDKYESNLKLAEQTHVNAVREHFAMRRDKIKTPCPSANAGFGGFGSRMAPHLGLNDTQHSARDGRFSYAAAGVSNAVSGNRTSIGGRSMVGTVGSSSPSSYNTAAIPAHGRKATNNTINALEWVENVDALDQLGSEGNFNLQDRFMGKVNKLAAARKRNEEKQHFAAAAAAAQEAEARNRNVFF